MDISTAPQGRWHQNIEIDGQELSPENPQRKLSNFWNEGKWNNFIKPLLPQDPSEMTFMEIGCNVGLYEKMATEYGFKKVIGIEKEKKDFEMAQWYRNALGMNYQLINQAIGEDLDIDKLPAADVVVLANMHYYVPIDLLIKFLDKLLYRTRYVIIVSRHLKDPRGWTPPSEFDSIRTMMKDWKEVDAIFTDRGMLKDDPHPREMWSQLFEGKLERAELAKCVRPEPLTREKRNLAQRIKDGDETTFKNSSYYRHWVERKKGEWKDGEILDFVQSKVNLFKSLLAEGQNEPILINMNNKIVDGGHRAVAMQQFGYKTVLARRI